jgi:serine/threonine-protein kinase
MHKNSLHLSPKAIRLSHNQLQGKILLGKYRLNSLIARGGMGLVYLARNIGTGNRYAIKILREELIFNQSMRNRFLNESRASKRIIHPAVVKTIDIGETSNGSFFIVMEYVDGIPLRKLIKQKKLSIQRTLLISSAIAEGLSAAHDKGIIHRDLKPENVLITRGSNVDSVAKVLDFGIARILDSPGITTTQHVLGTPHYMSPEQARGGPVDAKTDIYSLGVMMYEMISGELPFKNKTARSLLKSHISNYPRPIDDVNPHKSISKPLAALIMACLDKSPTSRPATMKEILSRLAEFQ